MEVFTPPPERLVRYIYINSILNITYGSGVGVGRRKAEQEGDLTSLGAD